MTSLSSYLEAGALISPCGRYRYRLTRRWAEGPTAGFIMLNPSTADATVDDPTIRRCIGFARREGCGGLIVVNLYAYRSPHPAVLATVADPHGGPEGERQLAQAVEEVDGPLIAAWGAWKAQTSPAKWIVQRWGHRMACLGRTKEGAPRHPLYIRADQPLEPFGSREQIRAEA